jgi:DnaK suppressor protein
MNEKKIDFYKKLLKAEMKVIVDEARKELSTRKNEDKEKLKNLEDDAFYESEDLLKQSLSIFKRRKLDEIESALDMIKEGTFGQCTECGVEISDSRLKAVPYAKLCLYCQDEIERSDLNYVDASPRSYKTIRKEGYFKKNFDESESDDDLLINMRIGDVE